MIRAVEHDCPFCRLPAGAILAENESAVAFRDRYPVSLGHTLVIPRRHVSSYFDLDEAELLGIRRLLLRVRADLEASHAPDGFNVGVNVGRAAGQTVWHVHVHLIPRYAGDMDDPRGGVRNCIPGAGIWEPEAGGRGPPDGG